MMDKVVEIVIKKTERSHKMNKERKKEKGNEREKG